MRGFLRVAGTAVGAGEGETPRRWWPRLVRGDGLGRLYEDVVGTDGPYQLMSFS